jgi:hypothetical protein
MKPTSKFEILRRQPTLNASGKFASAQLESAAAGTETAARGLALGQKTDDPESFQLATGTNFMGHLTRRVTKGGLSLSDRIFGVTSATPVGLESPFTDGLEVSVENAIEVELEGPEYLHSGTGNITSETAVPQPVSFIGGKVRIAQTGEIAYYTMTANNLTPMVDGNLRIRMVKV